MGLLPKNLPLAALENEFLPGSIMEDGIFITSLPSMRKKGDCLREKLVWNMGRDQANSCWLQHERVDSPGHGRGIVS